MADRVFTQEELNCIVAVRLARERCRLTREFENSLTRCMTDVHRTLHQARDITAVTDGTLLPEKRKRRPHVPGQKIGRKIACGEVNDHGGEYSGVL